MEKNEIWNTGSWSVPLNSICLCYFSYSYRGIYSSKCLNFFPTGITEALNFFPIFSARHWPLLKHRNGWASTSRNTASRKVLPPPSLSILNVKGTLDKYNIVPNFFPKKLGFLYIISVGMGKWPQNSPHAEFYILHWFTFEEIWLFLAFSILSEINEYTMVQ